MFLHLELLNKIVIDRQVLANKSTNSQSNRKIMKIKRHSLTSKIISNHSTLMEMMYIPKVVVEQENKKNNMKGDLQIKLIHISIQFNKILI